MALAVVEKFLNLNYQVKLQNKRKAPKVMGDLKNKMYQIFSGQQRWYCLTPIKSLIL